jgi:hypothetical protein
MSCVLTLVWFFQSDKVGVLSLYLCLPLLTYSSQRRKKKKMWNLKAFPKPFQCPEREASVVASKTLLVYVLFAQRLNGECSSSLYMKMQPDWLVVVDGRRTVVFRRYVASRGGPAPLAQACR